MGLARVVVRARVHLRRSQPAEARRLFDQVYFDLPGELAPKLALGFAAELAGDVALARKMYDLVSNVDPGFVSAVFGLARCLRATGDRKAAVAALGRIPASSALYVRARVEATRALLSGTSSAPSMDDVLSAAGIAETLPLDGRDKYTLSRDVFAAAVAGVRGGRSNTDGNTKILGQPLAERPLRFGLEEALRSMARLAKGDERVHLVDEANRVRPRTLI